MAHEQPELTTVNWDQAPVDHPESTLIGSMYQSVGAKADMVVTDASRGSTTAATSPTGRPSPR